VYAPHTERDVAEMLQTIGVESIDDLMRVPDAVRVRESMDIGAPLSEVEVLRRFEHYAARNGAPAYVSFLGGGSYRHYTPPAISALAMRGEFLTSYTPYQAEVSQGYLQAIYEWQTYICLLTGLDLANASVYDGATALAEGAIMALNANGRKRVLVSRAVDPNYREVLKTYCDGLDVAVDEIPLAGGVTDYGALARSAASGEYACVAVQSPNFFGNIETPDAAAVAALHASSTVPIAVVTEAISLGALSPPGRWGAHIAIGEAQSFGVPVAYGGPYAGFIASTHEHMRRIPGRLVGKTVDASGNEGYVLTLQAREQHIRRERAMSNICTNQAHCALIATIYLALMGRTGLRDVAAANLRRTRELAARVASVAGCGLPFEGPFFNEIVVDVGRPARAVLDALQTRGILGGIDLGRFYPEFANYILMNATELTTSDDVAKLARALEEAMNVPAGV